MKKFLKVLSLTSLIAVSAYASVVTYDGVRIRGATASKAMVTDSNKNLTSSNTSATELGYVSGVTSAIQTQLNSITNSGSVSSTEFGYLDGVTSAIQTQLNTKPTLGAVTSTEFGYLDGVTSAIQTQIDAKLTNPLTTKGDLQTYSTVPARLAVSTNGFCLMADSGETTGIKWAACPGGAGGSGMTVGAAVSGAAANSVLFADASSNLDDDSSMVFSNTTKRLTVASSNTNSGPALLGTKTFNNFTSGESDGAVQGIATVNGGPDFPAAGIYGKGISAVNGATYAGGSFKVVNQHTGTTSVGVYVDGPDNTNQPGYQYGVYIAGGYTGASEAHSLHVDTGTSYFGGNVTFDSNTITMNDNSVFDITNTQVAESIMTFITTVPDNFGAFQDSGVLDVRNTQSDAGSATVSAIRAQDLAGVNGTTITGIYSRVASNGKTNVTGYGMNIEGATGNWDNFYGLYIQGAASGTVATNNHALHVNSGDSYFGGRALLAGKIVTSGTAPAVSACGTSPSITGNDIAGTVTVGTGGSVSACTVTFNVAYTAAPHCFLNNQTDIVALKATTTTTVLTITKSSAFTASSVIDYHCIQ